jgi:hypothetical protein
MWQWSVPVARLTLLVVFVSLIAVFVVDEYELVRDTVRFVCINCLGLSG